MTKQLAFVMVLFTVFIVPVVSVPALGGALQQVPHGGDVFIGEEGLNLTGISSGTTVSWYGGSEIVGSGSPSVTMNIGNASDFFVAPSRFSGYTGNWYIGNTTQVGFVVNDPYQAVSVFDQMSMKDVTNKSVPPGDFLTFRVETNLDSIPVQRPGSEGFLSIRVRTADGTVYTRLFQDTTTQLGLADLAPDTIPWYWIPLENMSRTGWSTGLISPDHNRIYPEGRYTFWTESDLNGMKDNYRSINGNNTIGRTVSVARTVTIANNAVSITVSNTSVFRHQPFSVTVMGRSGTVYYLWVENTGSMSGMAGDQPPALIPLQEGVRTDPKGGPWPIGQYVPQGSGKTIQHDVAGNYGRDNVKGTRYYASVTLSDSGIRTVGFSTTKDTKDSEYSIRVERPEPYDPPASDSGTNRTFRSGNVKITVKKGGVGEKAQASATKAAGAYTLGETITFSGINTETDTTYLFITGPNLPAEGGEMTRPRISVEPERKETYARAEVDDQSWEYTWETSNLDIDGGTYTIYAAPAAANMSTLADMEFSTMSVFLGKPFIRAQTSPPVVAAGDQLDIRGVASGQPVNGIAVWVIGRNKVLYRITGVDSNGVFDEALSGAQTADMASGQYFVVVQHPMYNELFDVSPASSGSGSAGSENALVVGSYPEPDSVLFTLEGPGSLQGSDAANALVRALDNQGIDDIYTKLQFLVEEPGITIDPIEDRQTGDIFTITGTTNLAPGDEILIDITSSSFGPAGKNLSNEFSGTSGTATVRNDRDGLNSWSFPVNATTFVPDEYIVQASGIPVDVRTQARFNVFMHSSVQVSTIRINPNSSKETGGIISLGEGESPTAETTPAGNEDAGDESDITIGAKVSSMSNETVKSKPVPIKSEAVVPVVRSENVTVIPEREIVPPARPTNQPGFSGLLTLGSLGIIAVIFVNSRK
jgi:trimeric autotransporter adhesin